MKKPSAAILLVEDDPDVAAMFSLGLSIAGHVVELAADGATAVQRASRERFDLVFLDVELPRIDGLTALALLRSNWSTRDLARGDANQHRRRDPTPQSPLARNTRLAGQG